MARPLRLEFPGALYHATARGNGRKPIYRDEQDRRRFLERLSAVASGFGLRVHACVLMRNHYHLLVETPAANLSRAKTRGRDKCEGHPPPQCGSGSLSCEARFRAWIW